MTSTITKRIGGFGKGMLIVAGTLAAAIVGHTGAELAGTNPVFFEGAAGGAVLGAAIYYFYRQVRYSSLGLVDATSPDRIRFDKPRRATITHPPKGTEEYDVFAIETNPENADIPFKVWVADESGAEHHPYYATAVKFSQE